MKILSRPSRLLYLLAVVFFAPGIAALYFFHHPAMLAGSSTNKGEFMRPAQLIKSFRQLKGQSRPLDNGQPKWHLVLWDPNDCLDECVQILDQLTQIRLALGRHFYDVNEALLMRESLMLVNPKRSEWQTRGGDVVRLSNEDEAVLLAISKKSRIFIADPSGYLIFSYGLTTPPDDIYHDLKQLLTTTQTKSK
jgi:hypothetical protein